MPRLVAAALVALLAAGAGGAGAPTPPLILPLLRRELPAARAAAYHVARRSLIASNVSTQLELYGSVRDNGVFTVHLGLGTPPQLFDVIVDTGSTLAYVPCQDCGSGCGKHENPWFRPDRSRTFAALDCGSAICSQFGGRCELASCSYSRSYAEQSSSSGRLVSDAAWLGEANGSAVFGCETRETGEIHRQLADGIMGLGLGGISLVGQLAGQGIITDQFSLCYGSWGPRAGVQGEASANGAVVFGSLPHAGASAARGGGASSQSAVLVPGTSYYKVNLRAILVGGADVASRSPTPGDLPAAYSRGFGAVWDSGTTFMYLPRAAFLGFKEAMAAALAASGAALIPGPDPSFVDVCYQLPGASTAALEKLTTPFPNVTLDMEGAALQLPPQNYLFAWGERKADAFCLGVFDNGDQGVLLGAIAARDMLITYDRGGGKISFRPANCTHFMRHGMRERQR